LYEKAIKPKKKNKKKIPTKILAKNKKKSYLQVIENGSVQR
jgi:hypothetical protein